MNRRAVLAAVASLSACRAEPPRADDPRRAPGAADADALVPPRPPYGEPPDSEPLAHAALTDLRAAPDFPPFFLAELGGRGALVLIAARASPERHRPQIAAARLARRLGLALVPPTAPREDPLRALLDAADAPTRALLREAATLPDGRVPSAVTVLPHGTTRRGTTYSLEAAAWAKTAESGESPAGAAARTETSYVGMLAFDYLAGNLFRRTAEETGDGALLLVDNRSAFAEHPEARAVDALFDRLKRVRRFPEGLLPALARFDERAADEDFRAGDYATWLVHKRSIREILLRARALRGLIVARAQ